MKNFSVLLVMKSVPAIPLPVNTENNGIIMPIPTLPASPFIKPSKTIKDKTSASGEILRKIYVFTLLL